MLVYFPVTKEYNEFVFKSETVYDLKDEPKDFVKRWLKRGCKLAEGDIGNVEPDPRFLVEKKVEEKPEVQPEVEPEVEPEKPKRTTKKKVAKKEPVSKDE